MAIKKLIEVWDGKNLVVDNIKFLKNKTKAVHLPLSENNQKIFKDLLDTFQAVPCAGVAANQIGFDKRIFIGLKHDDYDDGENEENKKDKPEVIGNPNADNYEFYINPQIDYCTKKSIQEGEEGCLSIPEVRIIAERFDKIKIRYYNKDGKKVKKTISGFMSRLFQHELDHLDGILMVENTKIKNVYRISENENLESLYINLVNQLSNY